MNASDAEGEAPLDPRRYFENDEVTVLGTDAIRPVFSFSGWNTRPDGTGITYLPGGTFRIMSNTVLYALWTESTVFDVTYNPNGGTGGSSEPVGESGSIHTVRTVEEVGIERPGFIFSNWNTSANGEGTLYLPGDMIEITSNIVLYAQWTEDVRFDVVYDPNGGTGGSLEHVNEFDIHTVKTVEEAGIERPGFIFSSWNTSADGDGTLYLPGDEIGITSNTVLYAQWTEDVRFYIAYDPNGGTGGFLEHVSANSQYTIKTTESADVARPNYTFVSWNTVPDGSGTTYLPGNVITVAGNVTLYAQWQYSGSVFFQVTYNANSGTGGFADPNILPGSVYIIKAIAEIGISPPVFFSFHSWNTQPDGTGVQYMPGEPIVIIDDLILYAQWTLIASRGRDSSPLSR